MAHWGRGLVDRPSKEVLTRIEICCNMVSACDECVARGTIIKQSVRSHPRRTRIAAEGFINRMGRFCGP